MGRVVLIALLGLAAGASASCAGAPEDVVPGGPGTLELGTGSYRFEPIGDGQQVDLVRGAQGGWHFWTSLLVTNVSADVTTLLLETQPADETRPASLTEAIVRIDPPNDAGERAIIGWPNIIQDPSCLVDEMVRVEARLVDDAGVELVSERFFVAGGGMYPPPPCE